ncbi:hypothetical protein MASR2M47_34170 [Draconibacterium sp.]
MKKLFLFLLISNAVFASAQIQRNNKSALTIGQIMQNPDKWIGTSPTNIIWGEQNDHIYFNWNPEKDTLSSLYSYNLKTKKTAKVSVEEKQKLPGRNSDYNSAKNQKAYVRNGNLFLLNIEKGTTKQLTDWLERISSPKFVLNDSEISFVKDDNLVLYQSANRVDKANYQFCFGRRKN